MFQDAINTTVINNLPCLSHKVFVTQARSAMNPSEQSVTSTSLPETDDIYDFLFKVVLIGDAGVGKTCAVQRFKHGVYIERYGNTIGVDFMLKTVTVEGKKIKVRTSVCLYFMNCVIHIKQTMDSLSYSIKG